MDLPARTDAQQRPEAGGETNAPSVAIDLAGAIDGSDFIGGTSAATSAMVDGGFGDAPVFDVGSSFDCDVGVVDVGDISGVIGPT